ncbi:MAG: hypothetical protein V7K32_27010 [Nostoc sp.]
MRKAGEAGEAGGAGEAGQEKLLPHAQCPLALSEAEGMTNDQ